MIRIRDLNDWASDSGQCAVLRARLLDRICKSHWLKKCNHTLKASGHPTLNILDCNGTSPVYFCRSNSTHFWLELEQAVPSGERVVLDPSFRIVSEPDGYYRARHCANPDHLKVDLASDVKVRSIAEKDGAWRIMNCNTAGLGASATWETAILIGFYLYEGVPRPVVELLFQSGEYAYHFTAPDGCSVIDGPRASEPDESQARRILEHLEGLSIVYESLQDMPTSRLVFR